MVILSPVFHTGWPEVFSECDLIKHILMSQQREDAIQKLTAGIGKKLLVSVKLLFYEVKY